MSWNLSVEEYARRAASGGNGGRPGGGEELRPHLEPARHPVERGDQGLGLRQRGDVEGHREAFAGRSARMGAMVAALAWSSRAERLRPGADRSPRGTARGPRSSGGSRARTRGTRSARRGRADTSRSRSPGKRRARSTTRSGSSTPPGPTSRPESSSGKRPDASSITRSRRRRIPSLPSTATIGATSSARSLRWAIAAVAQPPRRRLCGHPPPASFPPRASGSVTRMAPIRRR